LRHVFESDVVGHDVLDHFKAKSDSLKRRIVLEEQSMLQIKPSQCSVANAEDIQKENVQICPLVSTVKIDHKNQGKNCQKGKTDEIPESEH
jgi:hypothetical protein